MRKNEMKKYLLGAICTVMAFALMPSDVSAEIPALYQMETPHPVDVLEKAPQLPVVTNDEELLDAQNVTQYTDLRRAVTVKASERGFYEGFDFTCQRNGFYQGYASTSDLKMGVYRIDGEDMLYTGSWVGTSIPLMQGVTYRFLFEKLSGQTDDFTMDIRFEKDFDCKLAISSEEFQNTANPEKYVRTYKEIMPIWDKDSRRVHQKFQYI